MQSVVRYNFKLRPGKTAEAKLWSDWCKCRFVWNQLVEKGQENYKVFKAGGEPESLSFVIAAKRLTTLRAENEWMKDGSQVVQQQTVRKWAQTYWQTVKSKKGRPRFKSAKRDNPTLEYTTNGFKIKDGKLNVAGKIEIPVVWSRELPSAPKSCTVFRDRVGDWFVSFVVRVEDTALPKNESGVGIDWGVATTATCSDSTELAASRRTKNTAQALKTAQQKLFRCLRGSKKRIAKKRRVALIQRRNARQRKDTAHKWAKGVVQKHHYIAIEDLKLKFLHKGTMAKQSLDNALGLTRQILISKAERAGRCVALVPPAFTTMTCSDCGSIAKNRIPLVQREFLCPECGYSDTRDGNAAKVILAGAGFNPAIADEVRHGLAFGLSMRSEIGIPSL